MLYNVSEKWGYKVFKGRPIMQMSMLRPTSTPSKSFRNLFKFNLSWVRMRNRINLHPHFFVNEILSAGNFYFWPFFYFIILWWLLANGKLQSHTTKAIGKGWEWIPKCGLRLWKQQHLQTFKRNRLLIGHSWWASHGCWMWGQINTLAPHTAPKSAF